LVKQDSFGNTFNKALECAGRALKESPLEMSDESGYITL